MGKSIDRRQQFEEFFGSHYGDRWPALKAALLSEAAKRTLSNPFGAPYSDYSLDPASLLPVEFLQVEAGQKIADFCASPGGKSLASIFALRGEAEWHCNDLSPARVARLKGVLHDCVPPEILRRVHITVGDASRWGMRRAGQFDRVLVDVPCSGERHLLESPRELERWSLKGAKRLVVRQHALLCSALDCLSAGGRLVYSTCSINPLENDGVIERLQKSREGLFRVVPVENAVGEPTKYGWIALPDRAGCGPIYACLLERTDGQVNA